MSEECLPVPEEFDFPFIPYNIQHDFMTQLYQAIENKKLGIFESPTGTGKSLSIICGAIRWLKDHNTQKRATLETQIARLETEKKAIAENSTDWISSQSKEIELTHMINNIKLEQAKILEYDKKIENIKTKKMAAKKTWPKSVDPTEKIDDTTIDDDEILLEEPENSPDSDDESENGFRPTKIIICSRTHSQLSQFVGEILRSPFAKSVRVASLASRQTYCINPAVQKLKSMPLMNERCLDMQKNAKRAATGAKRQRTGGQCRCAFSKPAAVEQLRDAVLTQVQDVEELAKRGRAAAACPYYASRLAVADAELLLVPYNSILHRATREANGIELANNVVVIDEAHNLLEAMAQMHNADLNASQIQQSLGQLKAYKQRFHTRFSAANLLSINQLVFVLNKLKQLLDSTTKGEISSFTVESFVLTAQIDNYNMFKLVNFCKSSRIAQKVRSYAVKYPFDREAGEKQVKKGVKSFLSSIGNKKSGEESEVLAEVEEKTANVLSNPLLPVISFLEALTYSYSDGRIFVHSDGDRLKRKLQFLVLNSSQHFEDIVKQARSVIVAGGTMKPIAEFRQRLFRNSDRIVEFSCDHIIPPENILPIVVKEGPNRERLLFNFDQRYKMGGCIKSVLSEACKSVIGGIVVFFPSYAYENWVWEQIKNEKYNRAVFREPQSSGAVDSVLRKYAETVKKAPKSGALLLSVVGGKLSEGLNFSDDLGRCIIVVGLPYANIKAPDLKEKMTYLDKNEGAGAGGRFYENLCMKAVNQSIGRAVRHQNDYATILLLDERYNRVATKNALPDWIQRSLIVCDFSQTFDNVKKFFDGKRSQ